MQACSNLVFCISLFTKAVLVVTKISGHKALRVMVSRKIVYLNV